MSPEYKPWLSDDPTEAIENPFAGGQEAPDECGVYERLHRGGVPLQDLLKELVKGVDTLSQVVDSNAVDQIELANNVKMMEQHLKFETCDLENQTRRALNRLFFALVLSIVLNIVVSISTIATFKALGLVVFQ